MTPPWERRGHALAVGKFYPPHEGHHVLIDTATDECKTVMVAVVHSSHDSIPVESRIAWLRDRHPERRVTFFPVLDDTPVEYSDRSWAAFLGALVPAIEDTRRKQHHLAYITNLPDVIYTGEDYGPEFARRLAAAYKEEMGGIFGVHVPSEIRVRKLNRSNRPHARATLFRDDPIRNWDLLAPATKAGLCKRVVVCGAESSGTSTLAKALASYYRTTVVPEYGRYYEWAVGPHHKWTHADFEHIAKEQKRMENQLARQSRNGLLICDTDVYATAMFEQFYLGMDDDVDLLLPGLEDARADLYIITDHEGVKAEDDGQRNNLDRRAEMTEWFLDHLPWNQVGASGSPEKRLEQAVEHIDDMLKTAFDFEKPIEYREGYADTYAWNAATEDEHDD